MIRSLILLAASLPLLACTAAAVTPTQSTVEKPAHHPGFAYALISPDDGRSETGRDIIVATGHSDDWENLARQPRAPKGEYLWFKRDGKGYVLTEPALLKRAHAAVLPLRELGGRMEKLGEQMAGKGRLMEGFGRQLQARALAELQPPEPPAAPVTELELERRMAQTETEMHALEQQMQTLNGQHEQRAREAEDAVQAIVREALANGAAAPLPR